MGYTHGALKDAPTRICTVCGIEYPNTKEYFHWIAKTQNTSAQCKNCRSKKNHERNQNMKKRYEGMSIIVHDGEKECIKCHRILPNSSYYFIIDKACVSGLRNICRECDTKGSGKFLPEDFTPPKKWSDEDLQILIDNYALYTTKELQEKFFPNRTLRAIESEANIKCCSGKTEETLKRSYAYRAAIMSQIMAGRIISDEWRANISAAKREFFKTHDSWWKGKKRSPEQCKQISERQKGKWAGDKNPRHQNPLNGESNGRWRGGVNNTYVELRSETKEWQQESMKFCGYVCVVTGDSFDNVHHTTPFRDIIDQIFVATNIPICEKVMDYAVDDFEILRDATKELHRRYGYGACMQKDVHKLFHDTYGYTKCTPYDFLEFLYRIDNGEFNQWFKDNNLNIQLNYDYIEYLSDLIKELEVA